MQCVPIVKQKCVTPRAPTSCITVDTPLINEFRPNPPDNPNPTVMTVELRGVPGYTFTGYLTSLENDDINRIGRINDVEQATGTFDDNGILVFEMTDIQNPAISVVLSSAKPGNRGDRMNVDSNGHIANRELFGEIHDAVGVPDSGPDELLLFAENLGGTNLKFVGSQPTLVFRDSCTGEWYAVDRVENVPTNIYDKNGVPLSTDDFNVPNVLHPTFGTANPTRRSSVLSPTMRNTDI